MKRLSIVIPAYHSEGSLPELISRLGSVLPGISTDYEVIVVDDGSRDRTWPVLLSLSRVNSWIRPIRLIRNFGQHNALLCGIRHATGDITVTMDDDLQQHPESIQTLLSKLEEGYDVVYGYPKNLQHGFLRNLASEITKTVLQKAMGAGTARHISPFRAFHTELREAFANHSGPFVNIDVLLSWATTAFTYVLVPHSERKCGQSSYTLTKLITHAINMLTGFSILPLQMASFYGFVCMLFGLLALAYVFARYFLEGGSVAGFPFLASIIIIFSGAQLLTLGIIGEYLARMYVRMSDRPAYIVRRQEQDALVPAGRTR
jgi:undecaprenyl-phosphate 4-deoxy-4-formamido-L-arabinose transferase